MSLLKKFLYNIDKESGESKISKFKVGIIIIVFAFLTLIIIASFSSTTTTETYPTYNSNDTGNSYLQKPASEAEYKGSCDEISYKKLEKAPNKRSGENYTFSGEVLQIQEEGNQTYIRLGVDAYGNDVIWVTYDGALDVYEGDYITIWGEVTGTYSYTSTANWHIDIPSIHAWYIE